MAFYWINDNHELITCYSKLNDDDIESDEPFKIISDEFSFLLLEWRSVIKNDRN